MNGNFLYAMAERLTLRDSNERGVVIGRAEYATGEDQYLLRYRAADGRAVEAWWGESALTHLPPPPGG